MNSLTHQVLKTVTFLGGLVRGSSPPVVLPPTLRWYPLEKLHTRRRKWQPHSDCAVVEELLVSAPLHFCWLPNTFLAVGDKHRKEKRMAGSRAQGEGFKGSVIH